MGTIFIKSKLNKLKIAVGEIDYSMKTATFPITEGRTFWKADSFGVDAKLFEQVDLKFNVDMLIFRFSGKGEIWIAKQTFLENSWIYPPRNSSDYVANSSNFEPKRVINYEKSAKIKLNDEQVDLEKTKRMLMSGQIV